MSDMLDFKKEYKDLYLPKDEPALVMVPAMSFIMVRGRGDPNAEEYQQAALLLYALCYTIKMSKMSGSQPEGYAEYVMPPLEGLWGCCSGKSFDISQRGEWVWTSMIRQPSFVTQEVFAWACEQVAKKKPALNTAKARLASFDEGLCVQIMHHGPFAGEQASIDKIEKYITKNHLADDCSNERMHHEIYLSDQRKTLPEKLKTVLRHPVTRIPE